MIFIQNQNNQAGSHLEIIKKGMFKMFKASSQKQNKVIFKKTIRKEIEMFGKHLD